MCLLLLANQRHPAYPLVIVANRDEFHERPTSPADWWDDAAILAGRDQEAGGTWFGVSQEGRFAAVTNYRDPDRRQPGAPSRGQLVVDALHYPAPRFANYLRAHGHEYNGFNLLFGPPGGIHYFSNMEGEDRRLDSGRVFGLSNHLLDTPWPKVERSRGRLESYLDSHSRLDLDELFDILYDREPAAEDQLPDTGVSAEMEHLLSSPFIVSPRYGTRCTTILLVEDGGEYCFAERTFDPQGRPQDTRSFRFRPL